MRKQIGKIAIRQTSKVMALFYFVLSAIFVLPLGILLYLVSGELDVLTVFIIPFIYMIGFYLISIVACWVYNLICGSFGGIEFELDDTQK